jgi:serine/threonine protein kinase
MTLAAGTRLGPYEILSSIGAGGMGEVYRARDTRLQREVAIKVLPELFAADPDRLARFEREAQLLASLNHPHIAAIYGLEETQDVGAGFSRPVRALILELVDGETLADRIARGPIPLDEAMPIARQIVEALEAAHEQGIIHRDLKPANIKITPAGVVKVLDFGLAKLNEPNVPNASNVPNAFSMSPTITSPAMMTGIGMLLATAAYMAPEQAKGRPADKRSDIWAFGCVLFEMLTGKRAFEGDDVSDTLAAVLRGEPDWNAVPADVPPHLRAIVKGCLVKDRKARIPDISTVRFLMDGSAAFATPAPAATDADAGAKRTRRNFRAWQAVAALLALTTIAGASAWWSASRSVTPSVTRFFVDPPEKTTFVTSSRTGTSVAISPDGSKLAFTARDASGKVLLWMRPIDSLTAQPLPGTDGAAFPFWSPDSRFIAYFAQQKLLKIAASGGPPQTLCDTEGIRGGTWSQDGTIVYNAGAGRTLSRVSSAGGQSSEFMRLTKEQTGYEFPWFLPDGRHFLFYSLAASEAVAGVYVSSLDAAAESTRLVGADSAAVYDALSGHLLFVRQGTLFAQPFDPKALALTGESFPIAERVETAVAAGIAAFSVSNNGILAYGVGAGSAAGQQMAWFDRQGKQVETVGSPGNYRGIDLAPDGKRVAAHRHDGNGGDIWVTDLSRSTTSRFTFDASQENSSPIWSPDGTRIVYASFRNGKSGLYQKLANNAGTEERLFESDNTTVPMSWSPDGSSIVYLVIDPKTGWDLWMLPLSGDRKPSPLLRTPFNESHGQISSDGKWLAYYSNETGRSEVYVQPFPGGAGKWQISTNGGVLPRWRGDGRELFYMSQLTGGKMMAVDIKSSGSTFEAGTPRELFDSPFIGGAHVGILPGTTPYHAFAVSADGQRFPIPHPPSGDTAGLTMPIAVVENWAAGLRN